MGTESRQRMAQLAWWSELLTLLLTLLYCGIYARDAIFSSGAASLSSPTWLQRGFCVAGAGTPVNSHTACVPGDLLGGGALLLMNWRRQRRPSCSVDLRIAMVISAFTIGHGFGHLMLGTVLEEGAFMGSVRVSTEPLWRTVCHFMGAFCFFAIGPFLGVCNGVGKLAACILHVVGCLAFLEFVPTQFVFGFVQLYLNVWYCIPRLLTLGTTTPTEVSARVDHGWALVSCGYLALMLVALIEMLSCDGFLIHWGGHAIYDGTIVVISAAYSLALWRIDDRQQKAE